ncbi:MAG: hypothetical protein KGH54_03420 [Candidatus Micrarchaeota archaeon]|nr:hypothetical protein [Candidatus Micrarchaeota archaeon]
MAIAQKEDTAQVIRELVKSIQLNTESKRKSLNEEEVANFQKHFGKIWGQLSIRDYEWLTSYPNFNVRITIAQSEDAVKFIQANSRKMIIRMAEDMLSQVREALSNRACIPQDVRLYARGKEECRDRAKAWAMY